MPRPDPELVAAQADARRRQLAALGLEARYTPVTGPALPLRTPPQQPAPTRTENPMPDQITPTAANVEPLSIDVVETLRAWVPEYTRRLSAQCQAAGATYAALSAHGSYFAFRAGELIPVLRLAGGDVVALSAVRRDATILDRFAPIALSAAHQAQVLAWRAALVADLAHRWPRATRPQLELAVDTKYPALRTSVLEQAVAQHATQREFDALVERHLVREPGVSDAEALAKATARAIAAHPAAYARYRESVTLPTRT